MLWPLDAKSWLIGKDPDAGKDWGQEEKGMTEDEMAGWCHQLTQWTWVWARSRGWWWTGKPGVLQSMELQRVRHNWANELNWTEPPIVLSFLEYTLLILWSPSSGRPFFPYRRDQVPHVCASCTLPLSHASQLWLINSNIQLLGDLINLSVSFMNTCSMRVRPCLFCSIWFSFLLTWMRHSVSICWNETVGSKRCTF